MTIFDDIAAANRAIRERPQRITVLAHSPNCDLIRTQHVPIAVTASWARAPVCTCVPAPIVVDADR